MTRLALETIALCGFDYTFNSFRKDALDPFIHAMGRSLAESLERVKRLPLQQKLAFKKTKQYFADIDLMNGIVDEVIQKRLENPKDYLGKNDFLALMLEGIDKKTGEKLDDKNIRNQLITFLIAGHETTSGMLAFTFYFLTKHPDVLAKAYDEVDRVLGNDPNFRPDFKTINQLVYCRQILQEALRLWPTAPAFSLTPYEDITIGGQYLIKKNRRCLVLPKALHQDTSIWGDRAHEFNPDNFSAERYNELPRNAYKPFGHGSRSCIGQHFAMVEATIALATILQNFEIQGDDNYNLLVGEALTLKPKDFYLRVAVRNHLKSPFVLNDHGKNSSVSGSNLQDKKEKVPQHGTPLAIFYGSNMGSCEDFAYKISENAERLGFIASVAPLDEAIDSIPTAAATVIITATYNGAPPDNAVRFSEWLDEAKVNLSGCRYIVLGAGNTQWTTYQAFPRKVDEALANMGASRLQKAAEADANADFIGALDKFDEDLWSNLAKSLGIDLPTGLASEDLYSIDYGQPNKHRPLHEQLDAFPMTILTNEELQSTGGADGSQRSTRDIEVRSPSDVSYMPGDHIGIFAKNREAMVERVCKYFGMTADLTITVRKNNEDSRSFLPIGIPITVGKLIREYLELQDPVSRGQLERLIPFMKDELQIARLKKWSAPTDEGKHHFHNNVLAMRKSLLDILEEFPGCSLPFGLFLEILKPIRPRYYSISSSPLQDKNRLTMTVGVLEGKSHLGNGEFKGVCSHFLKTRELGDEIYGFVKTPGASFRVPTDETPIIMVGPGTGIAPFRGFIQHRRHLIKQGDSLGEALLFFGCRRPEHDFLYKDLLEKAADDDIITLYTAHSHVPDPKFKFVQDRMWHEKEKVWQLLEKGAKIFVCGDGLHMAPDVRACFGRIYQEFSKNDAAKAELWLSSLESDERYVTDVFGQKKV